MSKRKCLSIKEKILILDEVDKGMRKKDIASKFGILPNSLSTIIKNRHRIEVDTYSSHSKRLKSCVYEDIDEAVLKWIHTVRERNVPVSGPLIIEKALKFAKELGYDEFRGSSGWLEKFKRRHGIVAKIISGENKDVSDNDIKNWNSGTLRKILKEYPPENIFNADETALFFQCLPQKTLTFKNDKCFGGKQSKVRITVLLGANMSGSQKLKPLVIGKSKNPRSFKGMQSLEVDYDFNSKSWMTSEICEKWVQMLDKSMMKEKRRIALVLDNCPAHPKEINKKLKNVKVFYLPPNTTSKLQPMDQGVIKSFKVQYRKRVMRTIITALERHQPMPKISLRDSISEISKSWNYDVTDRTIRNSFSKAGFIVSNENNSAVDNDEDDDDIPLEEMKKMWMHLKEKEIIKDNVQIEDFISIDSQIETSETLTESYILDSIMNKKNLAVDCDSCEELNEDDVQIKKPSHDEMLKSFETIRRGLQFTENTPEEVFKALQRCETYYENKHFFKHTTQTKLTDYFTN